MRKILAILLLMTMIPGAVFAAFKDSGWGVRPLGMGGAFTAVANDGNAPLYNPAGLSQVSQKEIAFMSARLFTGLNGVDAGLNYLSYLQPISDKAGTVAFTWASMSSAALYREDTGCISYGRSFSDQNSSMGVNIKLLRHEYDLDKRTYGDPVFANGTVKNAVTFDVGFLTSMPDTGLSFGVNSKNITSPDVGLKTRDQVPNENSFGIAYYQEALPGLKLPFFTAAFDIVNRDKNIDYHAGVETWVLNGAFAIRAGGSSQELTLGLGYEIGVTGDTKLVIDYAFAMPLEVEKTSGSHRMGLTLRLP
jgi:hypothetical protein